MKTFKIISLHIVEEHQLRNIELIDGLIINKEDENRTWLIEAFIDGAYYDYFRDLQQQPNDIEVQVVITHAANDPALFTCHIRCVKKMDEHLSILFEAKLKKARSEYAELLLQNLVDEGLSGQTLVNTFKEKMKEKPRLKEREQSKS
jgi:hypothetical protein